MRHDEIVDAIKVYHQSENDPATRLCVAQKFRRAINPRIRTMEGERAVYALEKVIYMLQGATPYSCRILDALLQLCRNDREEYATSSDALLVHTIMTESYFTCDVYVDTQDGVV